MASRIFAAFKHYNYRLWFAGQTVSLMGSWMQMIAQGIFVYQLTKDPGYLGLVAFASGLPTLVFSMFGGLVADRFSKRNLMVVTQTVMMVLAFVLSGLVFTNLVKPWMIVALSFLLGIANAFDAPARLAFVIEMVGKQDLGNAIAMNSLMFNLGTAVGPAISGVVYAFFGPAWCFFINGVSYIFIIIALLMMKLEKFTPQKKSGSSFNEIIAGWKYTFSHPSIRTQIFNVGFITIFAFSFMTLMPAWPGKVLGIIDEKQVAMVNGFIQTARGIGAVVAGLVAAYFGTFNIRGKLMYWAQIIFPVFLVLFAISKSLPISLGLIFLVGFGILLFYNMNMVLVQTHVEDSFRGRVMGIYNLAFMGLIPIGGLLTGFAAKILGEWLTVFIFALITLGFGMLLNLFNPDMKHMQ
jgi:MFS family permease